MKKILLFALAPLLVIGSMAPAFAQHSRFVGQRGFVRNRFFNHGLIGNAVLSGGCGVGSALIGSNAVCGCNTVVQQVAPQVIEQVVQQVIQSEVASYAVPACASSALIQQSAVGYGGVGFNASGGCVGNAISRFSNALGFNALGFNALGYNGLAGNGFIGHRFFRRGLNNGGIVPRILGTGGLRNRLGLRVGGLGLRARGLGIRARGIPRLGGVRGASRFRR